MTHKRCCLTFDLEPDCGGRVNSYDSLKNIDRVYNLFKRLDLPLTTYVSGQIFEEHPEAIQVLFPLPRKEFGVHGYEHHISGRDTRVEIQRGIQAYRQFFGKNPKGYRAPQGRISETDLHLLKSEGVLYDSSFFPTIRPGVFNNLFVPNKPFRHKRVELLEIPITVLRPFPIPLGLGYSRILGSVLTRLFLMLAQLPETVVICFHLHDIVESAHTDLLQGFWHQFYRYNIKKGESLLITIIQYLQKNGYAFMLMRDLVPEYLEKK